MTPLAFLTAFVKQAALAATALVVLLFIVERLAPGSVLAYLNLYVAAVVAFALLVVAAFTRRH